MCVCTCRCVQYQDESPPRVTSAVYLASFGRLVCGHSDGSIAVLSALQAATVLMLEPRRFSRGKSHQFSQFYWHSWFCVEIKVRCVCVCVCVCVSVCVCAGWPQHCILRGHQGPVSCLFYPSSHSKAYDKDFLLSGGTDFTVKLWSLYGGVLVHTFAVHGGNVKSIVSCPPGTNVSHTHI